MKRWISIILILASGCTANIKYIGQIADTKYYSVSSGRMDGPNFNALVAEKEGKATVVQTFGGPGLTGSLTGSVITAGAIVGAAEVGAASTSTKTIKTTVGAGVSTGGN